MIGRFADLAREVLRAEPHVGTVRLVAVDGPAGSGKTTFAAALADALVATGATVGRVSVDDLRDGWGDIVGWWSAFEEEVLTPLAYGRPGRSRRYDWRAARFTDVGMAVPVVNVLVLDGVGSAHAAAAEYLTYTVWVCTDDPALRLARLVARDGDALTPYLVRWIADEAAQFATDRTAERADLYIDGSASGGADVAGSLTATSGQYATYVGDVRKGLMG